MRPYFIIGLRLLWQWKPGFFTCLIFWSVVGAGLSYDHLQDLPLILGIASNALVTLANGGFMPVKGARRQRFSLWVRSTKAHRLRGLGDNYKGFSIGDILLGVSVLWHYLA